SRFHSGYSLTSEAITVIHNILRSHQGQGLPLPDDHTILIEEVRNSPYIIVHACFGTKVNNTLGQLIAGLLTTRFGYSIAVRSTPYTILFQMPQNIIITAEDFIDTLRELNPAYIEPLLERLISGTMLFRWHFITVSKRFGVIDKKANYDRINVPMLIQTMQDTPLIQETLQEIYYEKFDVKLTKKVLSAIQDKKIQVHSVFRRAKQGFTPIAHVNLPAFTLGDLIMPSQPEGLILETVKHRLLQKKVRLVCAWCGKWDALRTIQTIEDYPKCPKCDSRYITSTYFSDTTLKGIVTKAIMKKSLSPEDAGRLRRAKAVAVLVLSMGKRAIIAHAGRGVGARVIKQILKRPYPDDDSFYRAILEAERNFVRTRAFWS
ncbi:hypothetical protein KA005_35675, partial [bacterium]|nr:hypothetical protein [bacterium]